MRFDHLSYWRPFGCKPPSSQLELAEGNLSLLSLLSPLVGLDQELGRSVRLWLSLL